MPRNTLLIRLIAPLATFVWAQCAIAAPLPWLHQVGPYWKDEHNHKVDLKGINLGNWLLHEMWMSQMFVGIDDQCTLESRLTTRFGATAKETLMKTWRDHWITERDLDQIQALGFNCIRVPFLYSVIEDENNPFTLRADAWQYLDWVIDEAEARGIYTILDLHGAVGGQGHEHHTGCAGQNQLWTTPIYQDRTEWLWTQIAARYQDRSAVAAYDLLNEAWGTDCYTLMGFIVQLYDAVRSVDTNHTIILANAIDCGGIDMYGDPQDDLGMFNVAFTHHPYPGFFGWGSPDLDTHADWLACRAGSNSGICEWRNKMANTGTAMLFGEFQPYASLGGIGGEIARHSFDRYAHMGIASTAWAYKVLSPEGGQGVGTWGVVTNAAQPMVSANTWACAGWNNSFANACGSNDVTFAVPGTGVQTCHIVLKNGAQGGNSFNVVWDEISLVHDATGQELIQNGGFGTSAGWNLYLDKNPVNRDYAYTAQQPTGGSGPALRMYGSASASSYANGGVYQTVLVQGGETYTLSGSFRDLGSSQTWAELYVSANPPITGQDIPGPSSLPNIDVDTWSQQEIAAAFRSLSTMEYDLNEGLATWLTRAEPPCLISELCQPEPQPFFGTAHTIPGQIEAEHFDQGGEYDAYYDCDAANNGGASRPGEAVDIEICSEGGFDVGWMCTGEWIDYQVDVSLPGEYIVLVRGASQTTGGTLRLDFDGVDKTGDIEIPPTGDWQNWTTASGSAILTAGEQQMRFYFTGQPGDEFNINHFTFIYQPAPGDIDGDGDRDPLDLDLFVQSMAGPDLPNPGFDPDHFERCDLNDDLDSDAHDFGLLQQALQ